MPSSPSPSPPLPPDAPPSYDEPAAGRKALFWTAVAAFWVVFGFLIGNHLYFGMRGHGHAWSRIVLWQIGGAAFWIPLTPLVLAATRALPLRRGALLRHAPAHLALAVGFGAARLVPLTWLSRSLDPFRPVAREATFGAEYRMLLFEWIALDVLVYAGIVLFALVLESRRDRVQERLRASHLRAELAAAELRVLELEIRPHFLFNALQAVNSLVRRGETEAASAAIVALADLLRTTLRRRGRQTVTLEEEVDLALAYLEIERLRFSDRLAIRVDLPEEVRRTPVPGLLLQPLVENAVRHGVERSREAGEIALVARREGPVLVVEVLDDGPGPTSGAPPGVGLQNVRSRLSALYGADAWSMQLTGREEGGALARVAFPATPPEEVP